jgi:hypothetical protein
MVQPAHRLWQEVDRATGYSSEVSFLDHSLPNFLF